MKTLLDFKVIYENLPGQPAWEGSFYERLTEEGIWDEDEFWKLHYDLIRVARENKGEEMDRILAAAIVKICLRVNNLISAHYDSNDIFVIKNLSAERLFKFGERFNITIMDAFSGEVFDEERFGLKNPLIVKGDVA